MNTEIDLTRIIHKKSKIIGNKLNNNDLAVIARCPNLGNFSPKVHFFFA